MQVFRCATTLAVTCTLLGMGAEAPAQTPEQFYKGKSIDFVIGYPPGGSNDVWGRLIARHIGKHIPGNPFVVPKNTPGAGAFSPSTRSSTSLRRTGPSSPSVLQPRYL